MTAPGTSRPGRWSPTARRSSSRVCASKGFTPLDVKRQKKGIGQIEFGGKKVKLKQVAIFSRQFATMVNSGLPILRAIGDPGGSDRQQGAARVLNEARLDVEQGSSLSGAIGKHDHVFNNLYISMVRSGETGGSLDTTLTALADMIEREVRLRGKIKSAMTYPVAVVALVDPDHVGDAAVRRPTVRVDLQPARRDAPAAHARPAVHVETCSSPTGTSSSAGRSAPGSSSAGTSRRRRAVRSSTALKLRAPVFGTLFHKTALSRFSSTLAMLMKSGVPILQALEIVSDTVNNKVIGKAITEVQLSVRDGESIAKPLTKYPVFPPMVVQMISVGEETGQVDKMLEKIAAVLRPGGRGGGRLR